jgi:hypothetical protein
LWATVILSSDRDRWYQNKQNQKNKEGEKRTEERRERFLFHCGLPVMAGTSVSNNFWK